MVLTPAQKERVKRAAGYRCEYVRIRGWPLTVDHVLPRFIWQAARTAGFDPPPFEPDDPVNLAAACWECNIVGKRSVLGGLDELTGLYAPLFNPRADGWDDHFLWINDCVEILGLTPTGRVTVRALDLNSRRYRDQRRALRAAMRAGEPPGRDGPRRGVDRDRRSVQSARRARGHHYDPDSALAGPASG